MAEVIAFEVKVNTGNTANDLDAVKARIQSIRQDFKSAFDLGDTNKISELSKELEKLTGKSISLDIKTDATALDAVNQQLDEITDKTVTLKVETDAQTLDVVQSELDALQDKIVDLKVNADPEAIAEFEKELEAIESKVVSLTVEGNTESIEGVEREIEAISDKTVNVTVEADTEAIDEVKTNVDSLENKTVDVTVNADASEVESVKDEIDSLQGKDVDVTVRADASELEPVKTDLENLEGKEVDVTVNADASQIDSLKADLDNVEGKTVEVDVVAPLDRIEALQTRLDALQSKVVDLRVQTNEQDLADARAQLQSLQAAATKAFEQKDFPAFFELTKKAKEAEDSFTKLGGKIIAIPNTVKELNAEIDRLSQNLAEAAATGDEIKFSKAVEELTAFENAIKSSEQGLELLSEAANTERPVNAIRALRQEIQDLTAKSLEAERAGNFIDADRFAAEAGKAKDELQDLQKKVNALDPSAKAQAFARMGETIAAGFAAAQGAAALFGASGDDLAKVIIKVQSATALLNVAQSVSNVVKDAEIVKTVALTTAQSAYALVVGTSTGALRIFKLALASTGIGAIVVGLGLLIANWDKLKNAVETNSEAWQKFKNILTLILPPIGLIVQNFDRLKAGFLAVTDAIGLTDTAGDKIAEGFGKQATAARTAQGAIAQRYDEEIKLAQAAGQATEQLEKQKQILLRGRLNAELAALQAIDPAKRDNEQIERIGELIKLIRGATVEIEAIENTQAKQKEEREAKANEKAIEQAKQKFEREKALAAELQAVRDEVNNQALPENERELVELDRKYAALREKAKEFQDGSKEGERQYQQAIVDINKTYATELEQVRAKQFLATSETEYQASLDSLDKFNESEKTKLLQQLADKEITEDEHKAALIQLDVDTAAARVQIATDYGATSTQAATDKATFEIDLAKATANQLIATEQEKQAALQAARDQQNETATDATNPDADFAGRLQILTDNFNAELALVQGSKEKEYQVRKKYNALFKQLNDQQVDFEQKKKQAFETIAQSTINVIASLGNIFIKDQKKLEAFNKKVAVVQLAVDTAKAISATVANASQAASAGGPAAPFLMAGYIASGIATVIANVAKAKQLLAGAGASDGASLTGAGGGGGVGAVAAATQTATQQFQTVTASNVFQPSTLLNQNGQNPQQTNNVEVVIQPGALKTTVTETEITNSQQRISYIEGKSKFG